MRIFLLLVVLAGAGAALYWFYLSPEAVRKRAVERVVGEMSYAAGSNSRYKVGTFLDRFSLPDATIAVEVKTQATPPFAPRPLMKQNFSKSDFMRFVDATLYPLQRFSGEAVLKEYIPGKTQDAARVRVRILNQAEGNSYLRRNLIYTDFGTDTTCLIDLKFIDEEGYISPKMQHADCMTDFSLTPKGGYNKVDDLKKKLRESLDNM